MGFDRISSRSPVIPLLNFPTMRSAILSLALLASCNGQELTIEELQGALAASAEAFDEVKLTADGKPAVFGIKLGEKPARIGKDVYDGFRFRCPELPEKADFVWYFNAPESWGQWYILPVEGKPEQAFKNWLNGDKLYEPHDKAGGKERLRVLQTLDGNYFTAGREYLMWFKQSAEAADSTLRGAAAFAETEDSWDHDAVEEALGLKPAAPEEQVAALSSRGGMILLDKEFFEPRYAAERIDSAFFSIRSTRRMAGGFFLTTQIAVPPCATTPSFAAIRKKHGEPDFTQDGAEEEKKRKHAGGTPVDEDEKGLTRHYYDYFAFEVETGAKDPEVLRVVTHGSDFSAVRPPAAGSSYASIGIENLIVFHRDGKEVGRAYFFLEGGKAPLFIKAPPAGEYRSGNQVLIAKGGGTWLWESRHPNGKLARRLPLKANRLHGKAEGFHENGKRRFTAEYAKGELDGEVVQFDELGKETSRDKFKDGEREE